MLPNSFTQVIFSEPWAGMEGTAHKLFTHFNFFA